MAINRLKLNPDGCQNPLTGQHETATNYQAWPLLHFSGFEELANIL